MCPILIDYKKKDMYANQVFQEAIVVLKALAAAAANARSEVQKLLVVLEGPAVTDVKPKFAAGMNSDEDLGVNIKMNEAFAF